jgi:hypothetical protein
MKVVTSRESLREKITKDPDLDFEAGTFHPEAPPSNNQIADMFFNIANECMDCIDPATPKRQAEDFKRIADRATANGYTFYNKG